VGTRARSWREIADCFVQAGRGLAAAHAAGIVHRDFKPANVLVGADGRARVLDFGLARLAAHKEVSAHGPPKIVTSTLDYTLTCSDALMGTPLYMSPEQYLSESVDERTDQFSFCVALYAALHGAHPFDTSDAERLRDTVVAGDITEPATAPDAPAWLQSAVRRGLSVDPASRFRSMDALLAELTRPRGLSRRVVLAAAAVTVIAAAATAWWIATATEQRPGVNDPPAARAQHTQVSFTGAATHPCISPGGDQLAYVAGDQLRIRDLRTGDERDVLRARSFEQLRWSRDGALVFLAQIDSERDAFLLAPDRQQPVRIGPGGAAHCFLAGEEIARVRYLRKAIEIQNRRGEHLRTIPLDWQLDSPVDVDATRSGSRFVVLASRGTSSELLTVAADGGHVQVITSDTARLSSPRWSDDGRAVYYLRKPDTTSSLMRIAVDPQTGAAAGEPEPVLMGLQAGLGFSMTSDRSIVAYTRESAESNLWVHSREEPARQLTFGTGSARYASVSPDGSQVAYIVAHGRTTNLFVVPVAGGEPRQLTNDGASYHKPVWSPDGSRLAYGVQVEGVLTLETLAIATSDRRRRFDDVVLATEPVALAWAPASFITYRPASSMSLLALDPVDATTRILVAWPGRHWLHEPRPSPDARWLAVLWNSPLREHLGLWLLAADGTDKKRLTEAMLMPTGWSDDGRAVFAAEVTSTGEYGAVFRVPVDGGEPQPWLTPTARGPVRGLDAVEGGDQFVSTVHTQQSDVWFARGKF